MTFVIKQRGAPTAKLADFRCPVHGVFEALGDGDAEVMPCPTRELDTDDMTMQPCGLSSPWSPSPVFGRVQLVSAVQGKSAPKPHAMSMDLRNVGEGQKLSEWKKERRKKWREHDYNRRKAEGRIP